MPKFFNSLSLDNSWTLLNQSLSKIFFKASSWVISLEVTSSGASILIEIVEFSLISFKVWLSVSALDWVVFKSFWSFSSLLFEEFSVAVVLGWGETLPILIFCNSVAEALIFSICSWMVTNVPIKTSNELISLWTVPVTTCSSSLNAWVFLSTSEVTWVIAVFKPSKEVTSDETSELSFGAFNVSSLTTSLGSSLITSLCSSLGTSLRSSLADNCFVSSRSSSCWLIIFS